MDNVERKILFTHIIYSMLLYCFPLQGKLRNHRNILDTYSVVEKYPVACYILLEI